VNIITKKVLILINSMEVGGGAEKIAANLINKLSEKYEIYVVCFLKSSKIYPFKGIYFNLNEPIKSWKMILRPFKVYRIIKKISPEIIISFMDHVGLLAIIIKLIFRLNIPLIISNHTNPLLTYNKILNLSIKFLYPLKAANLIIPVSDQVKILFKEHYRISEKKLKLIYNGLELEQIKMLEKEEIEIYKDIFDNQDFIKFITVGRLIETKGYRYLIQAFNNVHKQLPSSKLFIIGDGPLKNQLRNLIKKYDLVDHVFLLGLRKNPYKYLAKSNIFVLSSFREGLPMVLLEALTCGLPIISTNCETGPKEILDNGKYGLLVRIKDSQDLAEKMVYLANNKELMKRYSKLSLERAKFFDINNIKKDWFKVIEKFTN